MNDKQQYNTKRRAELLEYLQAHSDELTLSQRRQTELLKNPWTRSPGFRRRSMWLTVS